jgi:hypothetical protein
LRPSPPRGGDVLPGAQRADRTKLGGAVRDGHADAPAGALALGVRQGQAQAVFAGCQIGDPDRGKVGAPQGAGEAESQQGAVAQAGQVGGDRFENLAQDRRRGGAFPDRQPAGFGGGAVHAGHGLGDLGRGGRHRAAADEMQGADGCAAPFDGGDAAAATAFSGAAGDPIGGPGGQAGQAGQIVPVATSARPRRDRAALYWPLWSAWHRHPRRCGRWPACRRHPG